MSQASQLPLTSTDGHRFDLIARIPQNAHDSLLWLPALGVQARHYLPFADAIASRGIAVFLHEWRGNGSSNLRPSRTRDWGYRELLQYDLPASVAAISAHTGMLPGIIGGHSLGGQLACCHAALAPGFHSLWLVASGTPWWQSFPPPRRYLLPLAYRFLPWLAQRQGALQGRRIGFGGKEARGLIHDWARVGLSNRYAASNLTIDIEAAMRALHCEATAVVLKDDWLAPLTSTKALLQKLGTSTQTLHLMDQAQLGTRADHFAWMKAPEKLVEMLCRKNNQ